MAAAFSTGRIHRTTPASPARIAEVTGGFTCHQYSRLCLQRRRHSLMLPGSSPRAAITRLRRQNYFLLIPTVCQSIQHVCAASCGLNFFGAAAEILPWVQDNRGIYLTGASSAWVQQRVSFRYFPMKLLPPLPFVWTTCALWAVVCKARATQLECGDNQYRRCTETRRRDRRFGFYRSPHSCGFDLLLLRDSWVFWDSGSGAGVPLAELNTF